jgi:hypothetical protein
MVVALDVLQSSAISTGERERERDEGDEEVEVPSPDGSSPFKGLKWKGASVVVPALTTRPAGRGGSIHRLTPARRRVVEG